MHVCVHACVCTYAMIPVTRVMTLLASCKLIVALLLIHAMIIFFFNCVVMLVNFHGTKLF